MKFFSQPCRKAERGDECTKKSFVKTACVCAKSLSRVRLFVTPWTAAHQAPLSMGFSRQEYWSGLRGLLQGIFPTEVLSCISYVSCIDRWVLYH